MIVITSLGDVTTLFILGIVLTIIRRTRKVGMIFLIALVVLVVLVMSLKTTDWKGDAALWVRARCTAS